MAYILDTTAILSLLLNSPGADKVEALLRAAAQGPEARVMVPFTAMEELEHYLLRRDPGQVERALALVESWPVEIVESYPQWRHGVAHLEGTLNLSPPLAWAAALALLRNAPLVCQNPAFDAVPGIESIRIP